MIPLTPEFKKTLTESEVYIIEKYNEIYKKKIQEIKK